MYLEQVAFHTIWTTQYLFPQFLQLLEVWQSLVPVMVRGEKFCLLHFNLLR